MTAPSTPCIKLCAFDQTSGLCEGCGRTLAEITAWRTISEAERIAIMAVLSARLLALRERACAAPAAVPARI